MKKSPRQLIAIAALAAIVLLVTAFVISAFTAGPGEAGNRFMALLFGIISVPLLAWLLLFCVGRMQNKPSPNFSLKKKTKPMALT